MQKKVIVFLPGMLSPKTLVFAALLTCCPALCAEIKGSSPEDPKKLYRELLATFPEERQGYGKDWFLLAVDDQPMTYGLLLSAEAIRLRREPGEEGRRRVRKAVRWLLDNRDLDGDGRPGWGIPQAWDAWSDGTTNPPHQPYTITTAIVLDGLLDALEVRDLWTEREAGEIRGLIVQVVMRWCRQIWSEGYGGGFFWYSPSRNDEVFGINAPAMFLSGLARLLRDHQQSLQPEERALVQNRADQLARAIVATVKLRDGQPFWLYAPTPNKLARSSPNDLLHHFYTLWGIERYRDCGGSVAIPWTREAALRSADTFWIDGQLCEYAKGDLTPGKAPAPARLWSAGMMLAFCAQYRDAARGADCLRAIRQNYGPWTQLRTAPNAGPDRVFPRDGAHVLLGLALHAYPEGEAKPARP